MWARSRITFSFCPFPFAFFLLPSSIFLLSAGCRNCDFVEAELRTRENAMRELRADLARAEADNEALVRELTSIRHGSDAKITPELAAQTYTLKQITLGRGTAGVDEDDCPGDEALQVVLEPRDADGHTIKAPGSVHVEALEINPEGLKIPLSSWDLAPDQVRHTWRSGLFSTGYFIVLPWRNWPASEKLRVIVRFTLVDGRIFEADKDISIRLTPSAHRKSIPLPDAADGAPSPDSIPELPPPRKVQPQPTSASKGWWLPPGDHAVSAEIGSPSAVQPAANWRPKPAPSLADSIQLLQPTPLQYQPGEDQ
jgi:hypothetical protein